MSFRDAPPPLEDTGGPQVKDISGSRAGRHLEVGAVARRRVRASEDECWAARLSCSPRVDGSYRSSFSSSASASRYLVIDGYSLLNARVGFRAANGWTVFLWSRNLLDTDYFELLSAAPGQHRPLRRAAG